MTQRVVFNPGTLRPIGAMADGSPPRGGTWTVWADEVPGYRVGEPVMISTAAQPVMRLVQGSYRLRFRAGEAEGYAVVFVPAGQPVTARINLDAGELVLGARRSGQPVMAQAWEFIRPGQTGPGTAPPRGQAPTPPGDIGRQLLQSGQPAPQGAPETTAPGTASPATPSPATPPSGAVQQPPPPTPPPSDERLQVQPR
jgi:hypothetical protein